MKSALARMGDRMLGRVLPTAEAGACVFTTTACKCAAPCGVNYCTQYYYTCSGACTVKSGRC